MSDLVRLDVLTREDCEAARAWRNAALDTLRTPFRLTAEMQARFYDDVVCDRRSTDRFYAVRDTGGTLVGMGGLINIIWEVGLAEISLIIKPEMRGNAFGRDAVALLLAEGFDRLRLAAIYGEVYHTNPARTFWQRMTEEHGGVATVLPMRAFQQGRHVDATFFTIPSPSYRSCAVAS